MASICFYYGGKISLIFYHYITDTQYFANQNNLSIFAAVPDEEMQTSGRNQTIILNY